MEKNLKWYQKVPHTYVILFFMIVVAGVLTWILPTGQYERVMDENLGREIVSPNTYERVEHTPLTVFDLVKAIPEGMSAASQIIFLIMLSTAGFAIINETGALNNLVGSALRRVKTANIPRPLVLFLGTFLFSVIGLFAGPEIQIPFTILGITIALGLGYDRIVGLGMIMGGGYMGFNFGPVNASILGTSHAIAGLPIFSGMGLRFILWFLGTTLVAIITILYANKIAKDRSKSLMEDYRNGENKEVSSDDHFAFNARHMLVLLTLLAMFVAIMIGASKFGWYLIEISTVFLVGGIVAGFIYGFKLDKVLEVFTKGISASAGIAIIVGIARGIQVVLEKGMIMDTIIDFLAGPLNMLPTAISAIFISVMTAIVHFLIPSGSGLSVTLMPILSPLAEITGLTQQTTVLAFQAGATLPNYIFPTVGATMAMLGIAGVPFVTWLKFAYKYVIAGFLLAWVFIFIAVVINYGPF